MIVFVIWNGACGVLQCYCTMLCHIIPPHGFVRHVTMLLHHALPHHITTWFCDMEWCMMWCGAMWYEIYVTMLLHHALPHHHMVLWYGMVHDVVWCDVEWDIGRVVWCGMCYNVTALCFATSHHHMVLWYGMVHDVVWCNVEWNMGCYNVTAPCFATSHHSSIIPHLTAPHSTSLHVT